MKKGQKQQKPNPAQKALNIQITWQKITQIQTSLRKITASHVSLPFTNQTIQTLIKFTKQILKVIQAIKSQQKYYLNIEQNYKMIQSKLANHDNIVNNLQQHHLQRLKTLSDQIKNSKEYYQKGKKNLQESQEQARTQYQVFKKQNVQLKYKIQILLKQKQNYEKLLVEKEKIIKQMQANRERFLKVASTCQEKLPNYNSFKLNDILCSNLGHRITAYLSPVDITNLQYLNKQCRVYITKSKKIQTILNKSIIKTKNRTIAYYHRHIDYFQKLYHKIPQQILQSTFYRYQILKQNIGNQFMNILNSSAMLFQGKFQDINDQQFKQRQEVQDNKSGNVVIGGINVDIQKQMRNIQEFNQENPYNVLFIDEDIIREFFQDRRHSKEKLNKEISVMYSKIKTTAQIYSVDVESIGKFITNVLINFSKVFVLSKNLYAQARNLQALNTLILRQLANWDKIQVQKNSQIQDLKAQLEAEKKLKIFFTNQSIKSQQRALAQQNIKLSIQSKFLKQTQKLDLVCKQKQELATKLLQYQKDIKNLKSDNKQIRKAYENGKQKYNKIIQELGVVKETILRMNIM